MRLLDRFLPAQQRIQATTWGQWPGDGGATWSGSDVSTSTSLQLLTVYGCVRLIADSIATLPVDVFRETSDGRVEVTKPTWMTQPTVDLDWTAWVTQVLTSLLLAGNSYLWRIYDAEARLAELVPLDPTKVTVRREKGRKRFLVAGQPMDPVELLHIPGLMFPGSEVGLSPVEAARQSIGMGMSAQEYGARFFGQGATQTGVIEVPGDMTSTQMGDLARSWERRHSGKSKAHLPGVLKEGAHWVSTGVTNEQAQFLGTRRYTAAEIAGQMFLIDPSDLGIGVADTSLTYANLQDRNLRRVQVVLLPWIVRLETAISRLLATPRYMKLNVSGLLRADLKTRYEAYAIGLDPTRPFLKTEEVRAWEELPPEEFPQPPTGGPSVPAS